MIGERESRPFGLRDAPRLKLGVYQFMARERSRESNGHEAAEELHRCLVAEYPQLPP